MAKWVKANRVDGSILYINMEFVWLMVPQFVDNKDITVLFSTETKQDKEGNFIAVHECVTQTPEELLGDVLPD